MIEREVAPDRAVQKVMASKRDSEPSELRDSFIKPLTTICVMVAHSSVAFAFQKYNQIHMLTHV